MKNIFYSLSVIGFCLFIGKLITHYFSGLPGSLYGLFLFTILLHFQLVNPLKIKATINWFIQNMSVCFLPAGVGIINHYELIKAHGFALIMIIFITTFLVITTVGLYYERNCITLKEKNNLNQI